MCVVPALSDTAVWDTHTAATEGKQSSARYSSALDCAVKTVRQDGWRALFKGLGPILLRDVPFNFIFFGEIFTSTIQQDLPFTLPALLPQAPTRACMLAWHGWTHGATRLIKTRRH